MRFFYAPFIFCFFFFTTQAKVHEVTVQSNSFTPKNLTISVGDTVIWTNIGGFHNVNGSSDAFPDNPDSFTSGAASATDWTYTFVFTKSGKYNYQCDPHVTIGMVGSVTVEIPPSPLMITEIMYNDPSPEDSYEFVEIYNNGDEAIDITGYSFSSGITFTFPNYVLSPGKFILVAKNASSFQTTFGMPAFQWDEQQGLNNSGETITLLDANQMFVDSVAYSDLNPWDSSADGGGPSLGICDVFEDNNDAENWRRSGTSIGAKINGIDVFATPGAIRVNCDDVVDENVEYAKYTIGQVTTSNVVGLPDSLGVKCELQGIVYGLNLYTGLSFTMIDENNDGINVFSQDNPWGYTVAEGDEIVIRGSITQFNGLIEIAPDTLFVVSQGNQLVEPTRVTNLDESTESQLIMLEAMEIVDESDWTNSGSGFNVEITNGVNTFVMRIDDLVDLYREPVISGVFNVIGIGGQFDRSAPYTDGYQIFPRYSGDIQIVDHTIDHKIASDLNIFPNPVKDKLFLALSQVVDLMVVHNLWQQKIKTFVPQKGINELDVSTWPSGLYTVTFFRNGRIWTEKVVKK